MFISKSEKRRLTITADHYDREVERLSSRIYEQARRIDRLVKYLNLMEIEYPGTIKLEEIEKDV